MPPVAEIRAPVQSVFFLPSQSPSKAVRMQPTRLPREKLLMNMPSMLGFDSWGKAFRKWLLIKMPAMIPFHNQYSIVLIIAMYGLYILARSHTMPERRHWRWSM